MNYSDKQDHAVRENLDDFAARIYKLITVNKDSEPTGKVIVPITAGQGKWLTYKGSDKSFIMLALKHKSSFVFAEKILQSEIGEDLLGSENTTDSIEMVAVYVCLDGVMVGKSYCTKRYALISDALIKQHLNSENNNIGLKPIPFHPCLSASHI